ncbi:hypothetical protein BB560_004187 [Smittium megazygosporum]|uniref:Arb2 domain-containing protein n=1 Tax=Smittium megazygosporum TaxID=133381 RepID=A0A2T9ZA01_9FUNG|nr:hypothetical protein BB560_004187 [Smittium megazygosporum]
MFVRRIKKKDPFPPLPSLSDLGYTLTNYGLFHKERGALNFFEHIQCYFLSKEHYRLLLKSNTSPELVYAALQRACKAEIISSLGLSPCQIPIDASPSDPKCLIYSTPGIWDHIPIAKAGLENGSVLSLVPKLVELDYGVVLLNQNENYYNATSNDSMTIINYSKFDTIIKESNTPDSHLLYTWDNVIRKSASKKIVYITSDFNGQYTLNLMESRFKPFVDRVCGILAIKSSHSISDLSLESVAWMRSNFINFSYNLVGEGPGEFSSQLGCRSYFPAEKKESPESEKTEYKTHLAVFLEDQIIDQVKSMFKKGPTNFETILEISSALELEDEFSDLKISDSESNSYSSPSGIDPDLTWPLDYKDTSE